MKDVDGINKLVWLVMEMFYSFLGREEFNDLGLI